MYYSVIYIWKYKNFANRKINFNKREANNRQANKKRSLYNSHVIKKREILQDKLLDRNILPDYLQPPSKFAYNFSYQRPIFFVLN